ncbi:pyrroline-5-carboxylate reductase [Candidatus Desulfofervidus auxilii]|uniref:Pyrroline-5-carboxylate reductase n=1 Tax=Desulfofervidus auxilii TaxID=1621989 RepID=A0A7U4QLL7_DESA2|nr:pyrroline-5-carboxylate reductase [Candidatus Desulfofervidus auxilii]AMM41610.1 pyrroline-5-carboxylate reductase [Candidatus Desulfofervidus auxilii]
MRRTIGFIGGGNMGEAIIKGILKSKLYKSEDIMVSDIRKERLKYLKSAYQIKAFDNNPEMVKECQVIILAVKPQNAKNVLEEIKGVVSPEQLLISIMAGISTSFVEDFFSKSIPVIRVMPNTPALVLAGMSAISLGIFANEGHSQIAAQIFKAIGETVIVPETLMDAVTGLSGSGPGYVAVIIEALADGGVKMGLPRDLALKLAIQTLLGTAKLLKETNLHPAQLKDMVTSPGGTTIAGLHMMELGGIRGILIGAIEAATKCSQELGK